MAMGGQVDHQLPRILERRRMAVEEPAKYGSTPLLTSRQSLSISQCTMSNLPTATPNSRKTPQSPATPESPPSVTSSWKLRLDSMKLQAAMKFNLEERCQDTMGGMVRPSPDSPISSSCCDSEECGEIPHNFAVAMNFNLDEVCQHSMSGQMKAWPHTPISVSRCSSEQYGEPPQLFCSDDEKDPGHTEVWNTLKLKAAMKLNLDGVSRDSMSGRVTLSPGSRISSSRSSSMQYGETPRLFCIDDEIHGGNTEGAPSPSCVPRLLFNGLDEEEILPCLSFNDCEDLDGLVAKHQQRQVAAGVKVLQAGKPSLSTQLLAAAE